MQRTSVLLLYGGESSEHDVSLSSARNVYAAIDNSEFEVLFGYIDRAGKWWLLEHFDDEGNTQGAPQLTPVLGSGSFITIPNSKVVRPDVILPILHGKNGEDGTIAALGQLLHVPVVGCDMTSAAISMDKLATKEILAQSGVAIVPYRVHRQGESQPSFSELTSQLSSSLFVKPARAGSSVGVSKVEQEDQFAAALTEAHEHDDVVLIEQAIKGRELETAVLGNPPTHEVSGVGEVVLGDDFYSYEEKYSDSSSSQIVIPAELDPGVSEEIRTIALKSYAALGCRGLARIDFFLASDGTIYLNELNTLPGFTNISMYPKLWRQDGLRYSELIKKLITLALDDGHNLR